MPFVLDELAGLYGRPTWQRRLDPTSELILTILTQNSADIGAEVAFEALRTRYPGTGEPQPHNPGAGWGGVGLPDGVAPDWAASSSRHSPSWSRRSGRAGSATRRRLGSRPRCGRSARNAATTRSSSSATCPALEARDWLTRIDGIGKKTASVLLLFSFGLPLMPVDRHVDRVARRVGLIGPKASADDAHDLFLGMLQPDQMYEAHVNLIQHGRKVCHAQRPDHDACPLRRRCRFVDPKAP